MLYALINGKLDLQSNKYIKEDSCTAAFFGPLLHLPDELIFKIIKEASSAGLPEHGGRLISFEFWPHWDGADTDNSRYVEPDLYLEFEHCALIVEAKFNGWPQRLEQWKNELTACTNEGRLNSNTFLLAIDGNADPNSEQCCGHPVLKTSWQALYNAVHALTEQAAQQPAPVQRILDALIEAGAWFGMGRLHFLQEITKAKTAAITQDASWPPFKLPLEKPAYRFLSDIKQLPAAPLNTGQFKPWAAELLNYEGNLK